MMGKVDPDYALRGAVSGLIWERNNLETLNDMLAQALDTAIQERDEARMWARRFYKALDDISLIALDYDGYRSVEGLMGLVDELRDIAGKAITGK